mmetsp:Transcript_2554/g.5439  ORF Transcript_2554/g.5439 Transcript_2554/m.5439 type:complete len:336 (-) Transcript_2554:17-1024(-)
MLLPLIPLLLVCAFIRPYDSWAFCSNTIPCTPASNLQLPMPATRLNARRVPLPIHPTGPTPPTHVALICDGNSRWAEKRSLPQAVGHAKGADALISVLRYLKRCGVKICTFYGFSTENWSRSREEINDIWMVMERTANSFRDMAVDENVRIRILGDLDDDRIPISLRETLSQLEIDTRGVINDDDYDDDNNDESSSLMVCLAINYGGRSDIVRASREIAKLVQRGELDSIDDINEQTFEQHLCTVGLPDPDLIIRTGGEQRLSNFLLWDLAYSELYFTDELWPDFDSDSVDDALEWYSKTCRRFGGRKEKAAACSNRSTTRSRPRSSEVHHTGRR